VACAVEGKNGWSVAKARVESLSHRECRYAGGAAHRGRAAARLSRNLGGGATFDARRCHIALPVLAGEYRAAIAHLGRVPQRRAEVSQGDPWGAPNSAELTLLPGAHFQAPIKLRTVSQVMQRKTSTRSTMMTSSRSSFDMATSSRWASPIVEEVVTMVKSWFHGQSRCSLVIFDSADSIRR